MYEFNLFEAVAKPFTVKLRTKVDNLLFLDRDYLPGKLTSPGSAWIASLVSGISTRILYFPKYSINISSMASS